MKYLLTLALLFFTYTATAGFISVRTDTSAWHSGTSHDTSTGKFYASDDYSSDTVHVYSNEADFRSNVIEKTITVAKRGTYFEVIDGVLYTRTDGHSTSIAAYNADTGALLRTSSAPLLNPQNGVAGGFSWGGYSAVNFLSDADDLYLLGRAQSDGEWLLLNVNKATLAIDGIFATGINEHLGAASIVNGNLFIANSYFHGAFNYIYNLSDASLTSQLINFDLDGSRRGYFSHMNYVAQSDTLYLNDVSTDKLFELANASVFLNSPLQAVPAPTTLGLVGFALLAMRRLTKK